jgi:hypothetical protein
LDTVYSLLREVPPIGFAPPAGDVSVLQPGSLIAGAVRQTCLIRKISASGALLHSDFSLDEGRRVELELDTGERLEGSLAWRRGTDLAVRFDEELDVLPILARNLAAQPGERRRLPRVELSCSALVEGESGSALAMIRDIAQGGAKIEGPLRLKPEEKIVLVPDALRPVQGSVRWTDGCLAGLAFEPELEWQELLPWLKAHRLASPPDFLAAPPAHWTPAPAHPPPAVSGEAGLSLPARVREGTRRWTIDVSSLTARNVEFECYAALRLGTLLWVVLPGLEGWPARIVSIEGYRFTCEFTQALHPAVLERILSQAPGNSA